MNKSISLALSAALTLSLLAGCGGKQDGPSPDGSPPADSAPSSSAGSQPEQGGAAQLGSLASFTAGTLDGETFTQDDIQAKDVTVINFWALTCPPCIMELPDLAEFSKALPDHVQVITVCLDGSGNEETTAAILEEAGFDGVTLISGSGDLAALCGNLMYTPTTVLADSEGNLVGEAIIGSPRDLTGTYLAAVNAALTTGGKAEISLES